MVSLIQHGGGHNCDCGSPHFDTTCYDNRLMGVGISQQEFNQKVEQTNVMMKKNSPNLPAIIFFIILSVIAPSFIGKYILDEVGTGCHPDEYTLDEHESKLFVCPPSHARKANSTLVWPNEKDDMRNCGDADMMVTSYCSKDKNLVCYQHIGDMCCEEEKRSRDKDHEKESKDECEGSLLEVAVVFLPIPVVMFFVIKILQARQVIHKKIQELFGDWTARGVNVVYYAGSKHSRGSLSFVLPPTNMVNNQQAMMLMQQQQPSQMVVVVGSGGGGSTAAGTAAGVMVPVASVVSVVNSSAGGGVQMMPIEVALPHEQQQQQQQQQTYSNQVMPMDVPTTKK